MRLFWPALCLWGSCLSRQGHCSEHSAVSVPWGPLDAQAAQDPSTSTPQQLGLAAGARGKPPRAAGAGTGPALASSLLGSLQGAPCSKVIPATACLLLLEWLFSINLSSPRPSEPFLSPGVSWDEPCWQQGAPVLRWRHLQSDRAEAEGLSWWPLTSQGLVLPALPNAAIQLERPLEAHQSRRLPEQPLHAGRQPRAGAETAEQEEVWKRLPGGI